MTDEQILHDLEQPRSMFSAWIGIVLLFLVFGLFVLIVIGAMPRSDTYEAKRARARDEKLAALRKEATVTLTTYGWVDQKKGAAHIPIDQAMQIMVAELAAKKPMAAGPIATPAPAAARPAPSTAPASSAAPSASPSPAPSGPPELRANTTPQPISPEGPNSENRGQPAAAANPASAPPGTQPGASATPAASPPSGPAQPNPAQKPVATPVQSPPGTPLPIAGATPTPP